MAVGEAVAPARPDVIGHQMTAIGGRRPDLKHIGRWFAVTNRRRAKGTDHRLTAAAAAGVPHRIAQSYARWNGASPTVPTSAKAFLTATVTHIAIDRLRSAPVRREAYVGLWFPSPLQSDPYEDPERAAERADSCRWRLW